MKKFTVVSGFLGAGKTTFMIALAKHLSETLRVALIVNDLGARDLIDTKYAKNCGVNASELTGDCICYQTENLVDRLRRVFDWERSELALSDIPGCGVGALSHVYHKLDSAYPGEFELAPFTVVADPARLAAILPGKEKPALPEEMGYLFHAQLREADLILLNKIDLISLAEREEILSYLRAEYPDAEVLPISAGSGEGIDKAAKYLLENKARLENPDIGYGGPEFRAAEEKLCWYNRQYYVKICCHQFDGNAYLHDLAQSIRGRLIAEKRNVPHLKLYAENESGAAKLSLVGTENEVEHDGELHAACEDLPVIINARAACESALFAQIVDTAMSEINGKYNLDTVVFFTECFGITDAGRM